MTKTALKPLLWLTVFVVIVGLACNAASAPPATPTLEPTNPPPPTQTTAPPPAEAPTKAPPPTKAPAPTDIPPSPPATKAFELDTVLFKHPDGLFELYPPAGWTAEPDTGSVSFSDPTNVGFIYLQVTNTGTELDMTAFERFADAREANFFATYDDYVQTEREVYPDTAVISIVKEIDLDGVPQTILTVYDKKGSVIYAIDFWADTAEFERYIDGYLEVFDTINVDSSVAAQQEVYYWVFTFTGPNGLFEIKVPSSWRYERSEGDTAIVDTFYSPDEHAVIQNITYDDGTAISKSVAGQFALQLLRSYYASDIRITGDKVQPDGSERLTWNSPSGDYSGVSFLETRGTTFLMFTVMYDNPYKQTYIDTLDYVISTYAVP